jgi:hypothetical protein
MIMGSFGRYSVETTHDHELAGLLGGMMELRNLEVRF